ncbi:Hypothetical predicted protein [Scomber scombrus]|uniref:Uncharacterized protein n=1 Tax=Scomber scombrus TaxID=13677 RepID=A0AAV1PN11_SCOSC
MIMRDILVEATVSRYTLAVCQKISLGSSDADATLCQVPATSVAQIATASSFSCDPRDCKHKCASTIMRLIRHVVKGEAALTFAVVEQHFCWLTVPPCYSCSAKPMLSVYLAGSCYPPPHQTTSRGSSSITAGLRTCQNDTVLDI